MQICSEIPDNKLKFYAPSKAASSAGEAGKVNEKPVYPVEIVAKGAMKFDNISATLAQAKLEPAHFINDDEWDIINPEDFSCAFDEEDAITTMENDFEEAKEMGAANDGYVYRVEDAEPVRRSWNVLKLW